MPPKVLLHGSGAIGAVYLYLLHQAGQDVTAVCRSNYDAVKTNGFLLDSDKYGKGIRFHPKVVRTPTEAAQANPDGFDYVIVATKALPDPKMSEVIAPAVTNGKTCIALIQNGIGIEDEYVEAFPENALLSCVVYMPTTQVAAGHIEMGGIEMLEVGTYPASAYEKPAVKSSADAFMQMMQQSNSKSIWFADVQEKRWNKLVMNIPWNPMCALSLSRDTALLDSSPYASAAVEGVMLEVVAISQALGYTTITADSARSQLAGAQKRVGGKGIEPSMLADILWSRRMEAETILGNSVKIAKKLGVDVPRTEMLYVLTKALDDAVALRQPGRSLGGDESRARSEKKGSSL